MNPIELETSKWQTIRESGIEEKGVIPQENTEASAEQKNIRAILHETKDVQEVGDMDSLKDNTETDRSEIGKLNKYAGIAREEQVQSELNDLYPKEDGYCVYREQYLRNAEGIIVKDLETGEARRVDFMVSRDGRIEKSIEVTSETAPKGVQSAKEERIREQGGNYILDRETDTMLHIPDDVKTEIWRRT
jgi:hypothetical protein